ncbi:hypothetical protein [Paenibacillus turpanensis]|uniref:hypothetical protein n=1 Tax=Paenibacillus turpanensis TaxID=2689078 RepID=UPI00140CD0E2|nr:hypothetical protein [Paenibacillus turpanensis]
MMTISDLYNSMFRIETSNPEVLVNLHVWNRILKGLPANYQLHDDTLLKEITDSVIV